MCRLPGGSAGKESACNAGDLGLILGLGRSPGEGKGYPLQNSGLENSVYTEFWTTQSMGSQRVGHDWETFTYYVSGCKSLICVPSFHPHNQPGKQEPLALQGRDRHTARLSNRFHVSRAGMRTQGSLLCSRGSWPLSWFLMHRTELPSRVLILQVLRESEQEKRAWRERVCVKWHSTAALSCGRSWGSPSYRVYSELRATRSGWVRGSWNPAPLPSLSPKGTPFSSSAKAPAPQLPLAPRCTALWRTPLASGPAPCRLETL